MTEIDSAPLVLHGRRRSAARLRDGVLLPEQGGVRRRTPVAAIDSVDVRGRRGREPAVVLTSRAPRPDPPRYALVSRSAPAMREFTEAPHRALPVRDAAEPRPDGASPVSAEPMEHPGTEPLPVALAVLGAGCALIAVTPAARGAGDGGVLGAVLLGLSMTPCALDGDPGMFAGRTPLGVAESSTLN
ncbi:hypothetical protein ABZ646_18180 [Streptomyces sp. NPDC007162]|uniref:hypothetical protein n=1 Tax=Streptomyces sp. NPDC007162 TaxID=3156917 RepID=UPI0033D71532